MPRWSHEELHQAASVKDAIDRSRAPRRQRRPVSPTHLSLREAIPLLDGLGGGTRAVLVRQLLRALGFDEQSHLAWRLEHKLVQALVLHSYLPEIVPVTRGLAGALFGRDPDGVLAFLDAEFPGGYVIKTALGDSSGESPDGLATAAIRRNPWEAARVLPPRLIDEEYVIQEQICIAQEYRVHSLEELVIEDLTFRRYTGGSIAGERDAPNSFVQSALNLLPDGMVGGSLLAWDVALTPEGTFAVVEVNFSGWHPTYKRGFHCSGYFHDYNWGACDTARLLNHVACIERIQVVVHADAPDYVEENRFYADVAGWQSRHNRAAPVPAGLDRPLAAQVDRTNREIRAPGWSPEEQSQMVKLLAEIDGFGAARRRPPVDSELKLPLSEAIPLLPGLAASTRALLTRQLMRRLGFDERRLTKWRLEHKLVQSLTLHHYAPGSLPVTCGLDRLAWDVGLSKLREYLRAWLPSGFVIKTALGDSSGEECDLRTEAALSWLENGGRRIAEPTVLESEEFVVQRRLQIRNEYRVHTVEDRVIEDLTVRRHHGAVGPGERTGPNLSVQSILDVLPAGITAGALAAWDVALLEDGLFSVIEINIGGIHTIYNPGFHSSGFYHHKNYGCVYTARLLRFIEQAYNCSIEVLADAPDHPEENLFYREVGAWKSRF